MPSTEVELRGPLKKGDRERIENFLKEQGATVVSYRDCGIFFNMNEFPGFGKFEEASARLQGNQKTYIDGRTEQVLKLKVGAAIATQREEHEIRFEGAGLKAFFEMVKRVGVKEASFRPCDRHDWSLPSMTMTLKFGHPIGDHYEAEMTNADPEDLRAWLQNLNLAIWTEEEFKEVIMASRTGKDSYIPLDEGTRDHSIL